MQPHGLCGIAGAVSTPNPKSAGTLSLYVPRHIYDLEENKRQHWRNLSRLFSLLAGGMSYEEAKQAEPHGAALLEVLP